MSVTEVNKHTAINSIYMFTCLSIYTLWSEKFIRLDKLWPKAFEIRYTTMSIFIRWVKIWTWRTWCKALICFLYHPFLLQNINYLLWVFLATVALNKFKITKHYCSDLHVTKNTLLMIDNFNAYINIEISNSCESVNNLTLLM